MGEAQSFSFDPTDPGLLADPYPVFNWLRDNDPGRLHPPSRGGPRHLSFGGGIHFCVGAELARSEGEIALQTIARRLPNMIVDSAVPAWRDGLLFRGLNRLDARWAR